ncbi:hypothetical protein P691DRAFT_736204 [Macrolepiota fuliginosa MF-IS2]|uniref:NACHT domain-containing protein n=1 Tax=Macrolepiota fuliginosa MF-IS2 TaxID=1400762 RepID=A0A9P5X781_9AGAR|nr:hypothetical protein P691DRAFT_736204 [Macrolepiota fuliginosa MF-IS2]
MDPAGKAPRASVGKIFKSLCRWLFGLRSGHLNQLPNDDRGASQVQDVEQPSPDTVEQRDFKKRDLGLARAPGSLYQAHNFVLNHPVFYDESTSNGSEAIKILAQHVLIGTEFDSGAREPAPRCHEQTRTSIIAEIQNWLCGLRKEKMLWLNGPAGVGKSAIMQTFAETAARFGCLGASLFFSRVNQRNSAEKVIPTLAFHLAVTIPSYRAYIVEQLNLNPLLLSKSMREQFHKLIVKPFAIRKIRIPDNVWCILLDGLDECQTEDAQCDIIQLISDFISQYPDVPLVWIVASRPEEHPKVKFTLSDIAPNHWPLYLPIDEAEARKDVQRYLRSGFKAIHLKYPNATSSDWPSDEDFSKLATAASGLFVFASTVIRFVADSRISDPISQLQLVLQIICGWGAPAVFGENPFAMLDALYSHILSSLQPTALRYVRLLLGHSLLRGNIWASPEHNVLPHTLLSVANLLGLQPNVVYGALQKLHSVLHIPSRDNAHQQHIQFLHASFMDYLMDPQRSKSFAIDRNEVHTFIWRCYHRIILQANEAIDVEHDASAKITLSWPCNDLEEAKHLSSNLLGEARYLWAHYLVPTCYCLHSMHSAFPADSISLTMSERLSVLKDINYNLLSENYCGLHGRHIFAFCTWFLDCWNSLRKELEPRQLIREMPISEFPLGSVATTKLAWVSETSLLGLHSTRYYSNDEKYRSRKLGFEFTEHLLLELSWLKISFPGTKVLLCENRSWGRGAFVVYTVEEDRCDDMYETAFYYLPLRDADEVGASPYLVYGSKTW